MSAIQFPGAAGVVTGLRYLLSVSRSISLIDCGHRLAVARLRICVVGCETNIDTSFSSWSKKSKGINSWASAHYNH